MATIASLFGPSAVEIVNKRKKEEEDRRFQEYLAALKGAGSTSERMGLMFGRQAGESLGGLIRTAMGKSAPVDPELEKASTIRGIVAKYRGQNLSDPDVLAAIGDEIAAAGYPEEGFNLSESAYTRRQQNVQLGKRTATDKFEGSAGEVLFEGPDGKFYTQDGNLYTGTPQRVISGTDLLYRSMFPTGGRKGSGETTTAAEEGATDSTEVDVTPDQQAAIREQNREAREEMTRRFDDSTVISGGGGVAGDLTIKGDKVFDISGNEIEMTPEEVEALKTIKRNQDIGTNLFGLGGRIREFFSPDVEERKTIDDVIEENRQKQEDIQYLEERGLFNPENRVGGPEQRYILTKDWMGIPKLIENPNWRGSKSGYTGNEYTGGH